MFSEKALERVKIIQKKIAFIEAIVKEKNSIHKALEDEQNSRASILMHLTSISEQFDKLLHNGELEILAFFEKEDNGCMASEFSDSADSSLLPEMKA